MTGPSSDDSSEVAASDVAETQAEDTLVMDPREAMTLSRVLHANQGRRLFRS
jgi:hypothetical protein